MFVTVWIGVPFTFMLEMAGLQKIPGELYEAGAIDGANGFQKFIYLTIPMMKSTFLINLIMITIGTIGYFDIIYALKMCIRDSLNVCHSLDRSSVYLYA